MNRDFEKLKELFTKFPGIGPRVAERFAYYIGNSDSEYVKELVSSIIAVKKQYSRCSACNASVFNNECFVCLDKNRDSKYVVVVEKDQDMNILEESGYKGRYYVFGNLIQVTDKKDEVRVERLLNFINNQKSQEVVIFFSVNKDADNTYEYIKNFLNKKDSNLKVTKPARGLSKGAEIEYVDPYTVKEAFKRRN